MSIWSQIGFIGYPIAFSVAVVLLLTVWSAVRLSGPSASGDARTKALIDGVLFWGAFATITGFLGTLLGIILAAASIESAGAVSTSLLWGGIKVALISSAVGVIVLAGSALLWFGLQMRWRVLRANGS